jgi:hypothetical protein
MTLIAILALVLAVLALSVRYGADSRRLDRPGRQL